jgi:hypothetical protein
LGALGLPGRSSFVSHDRRQPPGQRPVPNSGFVTRVTQEPSVPPLRRPRLNPRKSAIDHQMKDA